ncbi:MAG: hypothetical protein AB8G99_11200 [Planctomycetaceae bacterium]
MRKLVAFSFVGLVIVTLLWFQWSKPSFLKAEDPRVDIPTDQFTLSLNGVSCQTEHRPVFPVGQTANVSCSFSYLTDVDPPSSLRVVFGVRRSDSDQLVTYQTCLIQSNDISVNGRNIAFSSEITPPRSACPSVILVKDQALVLGYGFADFE